MATWIQEKLQDGLIASSPGQGTGKAFKTITMASVTVIVSAIQGAPVFDCWLEVSPDDGANWLEAFHNGKLVTSGVAGANSVGAAGRDICDGVTAVGKHVALFPWFPFKYARLAWILTGTSTPGVNITAVLNGK